MYRYQARMIAPMITAALLLAGALLECGGSVGTNADPCESVFANQCGGTCTSDAQCPAQVYCGTSGACTADCGPGARQCPDGFTCSERGRCVSGGSFQSAIDGSAGSAGSASLDEGGACAAESLRGEGLPLDMFIMMDRSGSMNDKVKGGTKWPLVTKALQAFLNDPSSAGIGAGIQYFSLTTDGMLPNDNNYDCTIGDYAKAAVPIAPLPGNAAPIINTMNALTPAGRTPTRVALAGAIQYAQAYAPTVPTHKVIVVLATDGDPNVCNSTVQSVADVAAAGVAGTPSMPTYVVGVGNSTANLNQIAQSGGTKQAFIVDTTNDTTQAFIDAMNAIRGAALIPCQYLIPKPTDGGTLDLGRVNVNFTPSGGGATEHLGQARDVSQCDPMSGGWYYDPPTQPTTIKLCPASCDEVTGNAMSVVDLLLGCKTMGIVPR